jgi:hypothetical protein
VQVITGLQSVSNVWIERLQEELKLRCSAKEESSMVWVPCLIIANRRVCLLFVFLDRTLLCLKSTYVKTKSSITVYTQPFLIQGSISSLMMAEYV